MSKRSARRKRMETRATQSIKSDAYLEQFFGLRGASGGYVSPEDIVSQLAIAAACVSKRSEILASVPLNVHRNIGSADAALDYDHALWDVLNVAPNNQHSAFEFRELMIRCHDLYGNFYARIERNGRGVVTALYPFVPHQVHVERLASGALRYEAVDENNRTWTLLEDEMLHVRGPTRDGALGMSPLQIARGAMGLAIAQADTHASLIKNGLRPSGAFSTEQRLDANQLAVLRQQAEGMYAGASNAGKFLVLGGGLKYAPLSFTPEDAEFLASRKLSLEDVARLFNVPPTCVGLTERATYSNVENEAISLVRYCLAPLAARIEAALVRCLLTTQGRRAFFFRHSFAELLRGDMLARYQSYRIGRELGALSANDVRRMENEAPIANGDDYNMPANWTKLGAETNGSNLA